MTWIMAVPFSHGCHHELNKIIKLCKIRVISSKPFPQRKEYIILLGYQISILLCSCRLYSAELRVPDNSGIQLLI